MNIDFRIAPKTTSALPPTIAEKRATFVIPTVPRISSAQPQQETSCLYQFLISVLNFICSFFCNAEERNTLRASIYCTEFATSFIGNDTTFKFSEHLKYPNGAPISIDPKDFYVCVNTTSQGLKAILQDIINPGSKSGVLYLPSALFREAKEGETIRFKYDDHTFELTCKQALHPSRRFSFEDIFQQLQITASQENRYRFEQDRPSSLKQCMGITVGKDFREIGPSFAGKENIDQIASTYQILSCGIGYESSQLFFEIDAPGISLNRVHFYLNPSEIKENHGRLFICIPPKNRQNKHRGIIFSFSNLNVWNFDALKLASKDGVLQITIPQNQPIVTHPELPTF